MRVLGCAVANARLILRGIGEPDPDHRGARLPPRRCTIQALEIYMTDRQDCAALEVVKAGGGRPAQVASQSLLCLRVNEAHEGRATLPLITRLTHAMLDQWLTGDPTQQYLSVFERFEQEYGVRYRESDGSSVAITSHMCRRLFVTTGLRAGASTLDIARWQGREHLGDIKAYDKRSMADKVRMVKDAIRAGRLRGTVAQAYVQLADDVRDQWLENQVQSMHVTPLGLCVHDFTAAPCPYHLNCVKKCGEYLMDPNDPLQVRQLVQLERRTRVLHDEAQRAEAAGTPLAASYVEDLRETLENLMHILRMTAEPGELARPFAEQPSRHQPLRGQS